jgi:hypothetical protein
MPPGSANASQPRGYVDPIAIDVIRFGNNVAEVDPNPEGDALVLGRIRISVGHTPLHLGSASHRVDHAEKLCQHSIAGVFDNSSAVLLDLRVDQLAEMGFETFMRSLLIRAHQARVPRYVGGKDRGEAADRRHVSPGSRLANQV